MIMNDAVSEHPHIFLVWVDVLSLSGESFLFIFMALSGLSCGLDSLR